MNVKKQLKKLQTMLNADERERLKRRGELKALLHKLKSKEKHLAAKLEDERDSDKKARLKDEVALLHAQRRKGLKALQGQGD